MAKKISVTAHEYQELEKLADIVNNLNVPSGKRKIAKAQYEAILRLAKNRPNEPRLNEPRLSDSRSRIV